MQIFPVQDKKDEQLFIEAGLHVYKNDPNYIRPLDKDVLEIFDPALNKAFRTGKTMRWVLTDDEGIPSGRIAAFVNKKYKNKGDDFPVGGIGFFECIHKQEFADLLFDNARHWLLQQGVQAMDGPINFGERDRFWGLLIKGFQAPLYCMNYNPSYYLELFENYGFKLFYEQICLGLDPKQPLSEKIIDRHAKIASETGFTVRNIQKSNLSKYASDFAEVYNKAWAGHDGLKQMSKEQVLILFKKMKPVMDERIIWFAYHHDKPIALFVNLPDINQWIGKLNGKFGLIQKLKFLWLKKIDPCRKFTGLVFGVVPEWQGKGVDAFLIGEAHKMISKPILPYQSYEMQWIGDFNPKMLNVGQGLGDVYPTRILATYRYLFDRSAPFKRHPPIN
jgi:hypothetical protein